jgi:hypothetical protein
MAGVGGVSQGLLPCGVPEGVCEVVLVVVVGLVWSELRRRRRSHRPATTVPWPAGGEEKEEGESERERVGRAHVLGRPDWLGRAEKEKGRWAREKEGRESRSAGGPHARVGRAKRRERARTYG